MELHYKCTMWCKLKFADNTSKENLIKKLNEGHLPIELQYDDIKNELINAEWSIMDDTEEYISVNENDGQSTIELYNNITEGPIWDNSYESEIKRNLK